jgi:DNA polymerase-1
MDREALEKLDNYYHARPLVATILAIRDATKQLSVLKTEVDPDGRMRTSYNVAGTETGRFSSSTNAFGTGTNLQNITASLRKMFVADRGYKICGIDLEQAESREVGWLSGIICNDWSYLDACYSGDLHTLVAQTAWPSLEWSSDPKHNRRVADTPFYRNLTYRDMAKKLGHGSNYRGLPPTMARHAKIPTATAEHFQRAYFERFAGIPKWHRWVAGQLQTTHSITTPFGRQRTFFGRSNDDTTLREAIAFSPQSATADRLNLVLWRVWYHMPQVQLIAQVHDALYFQYRETEDEVAIIEEALSHFHIAFEHSGHTLIVPGEAKVGWNWGNFDANSNPDGLAKWKNVKDPRKRTPILNQKL